MKELETVAPGDPRKDLFSKAECRKSTMPPRAKKRARAGYMISAVASCTSFIRRRFGYMNAWGCLKPSRSQGNTRLVHRFGFGSGST